MKQTPNLNLAVHERVDGETTFIDYRSALSDNFEKIDIHVANLKQKQIEDKQELINADNKLKEKVEELNTTVNNFTGDIDSTVEDLTNKVETTENTLNNKADKKHSHTKTEIGLGLVDNFATASFSEAIEGKAMDKFMTPALVMDVVKNVGGGLNPVARADSGAEFRELIKSIYTTEENQKEFNIPFGTLNIEVYTLEVRVGGVPLFHERYKVEGKTVILNEDEVGLPANKRVDFVIRYLEQVRDNNLPVRGRNIEDGTVAYNKLTREVQDKLDKVQELKEQAQQLQNEINQINLDLDSISTDWNSITSKPTTFPPNSHQHYITDVIALQDTLNQKINKAIDMPQDTDINTIIETGIYKCSKWGGDTPYGIADTQGTVICVYYTGGGDMFWTHQTFYSPHQSDTYMRIRGGATWGAWSRIGNDADKLNGLDSTKFVRMNHDISVEEMNNPNFPYSYRTRTNQCATLGLPHNWAHIDYFRHSGTGYGFQMAYPLDPNEGDKAIYYRASIQETWRPWAQLYDSKHKPTCDDIGAATSNHNHDDRYYTESEINTKLNGKSNTDHTHDRVNGIKFYPAQALTTSGAQYFYAFNGGDDTNCYVMPFTTFASAGHDHSWDNILNKPSVFSPAAHRHNASDINNTAYTYMTNGVDINDTNLKQFYGTCVTGSASAPNTDWWHIINVPHGENNGYGGQIAIGYHGNHGLQVRSANGTSWGGWYDVIGEIEKAKSSGGARYVEVPQGGGTGDTTINDAPGYIYIYTTSLEGFNLMVDGTGYKKPFITSQYGSTYTLKIPFAREISISGSRWQDLEWYYTRIEKK